MANTNRITINLSENEYKALLTLSKKDDRSLAWLGRRAIVQFINKRNETILSSNPNLQSYSKEKLQEKSNAS